MSTPRTQRGIIARKMWAVNFNNASPCLYSSKLIAERVIGNEFDRFKAYPVAVLDLRPEAVEKMVEAVASKIHGRLSAMGFNRNAPNGRPIAEAVARAALSCILPLRKRGKP